jgi:predicted transcriptional regulator
MIRPVIGKPLPLGIANPVSVNRLKVYPNPCTAGLVYISTDESGTLRNKQDWRITINSLTGQEVFHSQGSDVLDVSGLYSGIYIIDALNTRTSMHYVSKLVIMK